MKAMLKKLNSSCGASIIFALIFILICTVIGMIILTASTANISKTEDRRAEQQAYFSLSSAARLLQDTLENTTCVGWESETLYSCGIHSDTTGLCGETDFCETSNILSQAAYDTYRSQTVYVSSKATGYEEEIMTLETDEEEMDKVYADITMDKDYDTMIKLTVEGSDYAMTLTFRATVQNTKSQSISYCQHTFTETDEAGEEVEVTKTFPVITNTRTTKIIWDGGKITKGVTTE